MLHYSLSSLVWYPVDLVYYLCPMLVLSWHLVCSFYGQWFPLINPFLVIFKKTSKISSMVNLVCVCKVDLRNLCKKFSDKSGTMHLQICKENMFIVILLYKWPADRYSLGQVRARVCTMSRFTSYERKRHQALWDRLWSRIKKSCTLIAYFSQFPNYPNYCKWRVLPIVIGMVLV